MKKTIILISIISFLICIPLIISLNVGIGDDEIGVDLIPTDILGSDITNDLGWITSSGADTNASTECSGDEVLLGNTTCKSITTIGTGGGVSLVTIVSMINSNLTLAYSMINSNYTSAITYANTIMLSNKTEIYNNINLNLTEAKTYSNTILSGNLTNYAKYQFQNNNFNGSGNFTTSGNGIFNIIKATGDGIFKRNVNATRFFGRFNWTSSDTWNIFDGSTLTFNESKFDPVYWNPTQSEAVVGTIDGGTLVDTQHPNADYDRITFNFSEEAGSPGLELYINFTGLTVDTFSRGIMRYKTNALKGDYPLVQMWSYTNDAWEDYPSIIESETFATMTQPVFDGASHISDGVAQMRIYKAGAGKTQNHYYVDWIAIVSGIGLPASAELDPRFNIWLHDASLESNLNGNEYNLTNISYGIFNIIKATGDGTIWSDGTTGATPTSGAGTRMMWVPFKAAFRTGSVEGTQWDTANLGTHSVAMGYNTIASHYSLAVGYNTIASGTSSFATGFNTVASGGYSVAMGYNTNASGQSSLAMGSYTKAISRGSFAIGWNDNEDLTSFRAGADIYDFGAIAMGFASEGHTLKSLGIGSVAIGQDVNANKNSALAFGKDFTNNITNSFAVGFGEIDLHITSGIADFKDTNITTTGNVNASYFCNSTNCYSVADFLLDIDTDSWSTNYTDYYNKTFIDNNFTNVAYMNNVNDGDFKIYSNKTTQTSFVSSGDNYNFTGGNVYLNNFSRTINGSGTLYPTDSYGMFNKFTWDYDMNRTGKDDVFGINPNYYGSYTEFYMSGDFITDASLGPGVTEFIGSYNRVTMASALTTTGAGQTYKLIGGMFSARPTAIMTETAGDLTLNAYGGYFETNPTLTSSTAENNFYGGYFDGSGTSTGTSTSYGVYITASSSDTNYGIYEGGGQGTLLSYFEGNISSYDVTDRTPAFLGSSQDALTQVLNIKNKDGEIDHSTLPDLAKRTVTRVEKYDCSMAEEIDPLTKEIIEVEVCSHRNVEEPARSLSGMTTITIEAIKGLAEENQMLNQTIQILNQTIQLQQTEIDDLTKALCKYHPEDKICLGGISP